MVRMPRLSLVSTSPVMGRHAVSIGARTRYICPSGLSVGRTVKRYFICRDDSVYGSLRAGRQRKRDTIIVCRQACKAPLSKHNFAAFESAAYLRGRMCRAYFIPHRTAYTTFSGNKTPCIRTCIGSLAIEAIKKSRFRNFL